MADITKGSCPAKICATCIAPFTITEADLAFYEKAGPVIGGKSYAFNPPLHCPDCRAKRRLTWRNERSLYPRKCDLTGKPIVSIYAPEKPYKVYDREAWWGDGWDATDYGRAFDFSRPFFDQIAELLLVVPKAAVISIAVENSTYCNFQNDSKSCYLTFGSGFMEDCQYCDWTYNAKNTFDCSFCTRSELDTMNVDCRDTYHSAFCTDCQNVSDSAYCFDCRNCQNCFGCVGLRNKSYYIFNTPYSHEEYAKKVAESKKPEMTSTVAAEFEKLKLAHPHLSSRIFNSEACSGDDIYNSKNCIHSFGVRDMQDCSYITDAFSMKDCMDANRSGLSELTYEIAGGGYSQRVAFSFLSCYCSFSCYMIECMNVKNCFGCVGLKQKEYCILNKQYTKEEYEEMVPRIIEHMKKPIASTASEWGEFFPPSIGLFSYNEAIAQDFYPLTKAQALKEGFLWRDATREMKEFKLTPQEIAFYKKEGLPLPPLHPNERYRERLARKLPRRLWDRTCGECGVAIKTPYAPDRTEKVVCESCYLKAVY